MDVSNVGPDSQRPGVAGGGEGAWQMLGGAGDEFAVMVLCIMFCTS